jgi:hypothetical protein
VTYGTIADLWAGVTVFNSVLSMRHIYTVCDISILYTSDASSDIRVLRMKEGRAEGGTRFSRAHEYIRGRTSDQTTERQDSISQCQHTSDKKSLGDDEATMLPQLNSEVVFIGSGRVHVRRYLSNSYQSQTLTPLT